MCTSKCEDVLYVCKWIDLLLSVLGLPVQISPVDSFINCPNPNPGSRHPFNWLGGDVVGRFDLTSVSQPRTF